MKAKDFEEGISSIVLNAQAFRLALRGYLASGTRSRYTREEARDMWDEVSAVARGMLLSFLESQRPGRSRALKEVGRCFERSSVALRELLFAILRFLCR